MRDILPFNLLLTPLFRKKRPKTRIIGKWVFVVSQRAQLPHSYFTQVSGNTPKVLFQTCRRFDFCQIFGMFDLAPWFLNKYLKMGKTWDFQHHVLVQLSDYNIINPVLIQYVFLKYLLSTFSCMWPLIMFHIQDSKRSQKEAATALDEEQKKTNKQGKLMPFF